MVQATKINGLVAPSEKFRTLEVSDEEKLQAIIKERDELKADEIQWRGARQQLMSKLEAKEAECTALRAELQASNADAELQAEGEQFSHVMNHMQKMTKENIKRSMNRFRSPQQEFERKYMGHLRDMDRMDESSRASGRSFDSYEAMFRESSPPPDHIVIPSSPHSTTTKLSASTSVSKSTLTPLIEKFRLLH